MNFLNFSARWRGGGAARHAHDEFCCVPAPRWLRAQSAFVFIKNSRHFKTRRARNFVLGAAKLHLQSSVRCNQAVR